MAANKHSDATSQLVVRHLGVCEYEPIWQAMQRFTDNRNSDDDDEIWLLQHTPVFTQGQAGKAEHILNPGAIPVIQVDRGGQVTYHGPGQLVAYLLIDLKRLGIGVRELVTTIETALVDVLAYYHINASPRVDAPGVYINEEAAPVSSSIVNLADSLSLPVDNHTGAKIAQLGLRVRRGCSFHGLSLNVDMDMQPFQRINPCGHAGLAVTSMQLQCGEAPTISDLSGCLLDQLSRQLGYNSRLEFEDGQLLV